MSKTIQMYTDGACSGNPGPGGYAVVVVFDKPEAFYGYETETTNNRMELTAVVNATDIAIGFIASGDCDEVYINLDSAYVYNAIDQNWLSVWAQNNWKNKSNATVKNADLWKEMVKLLGRQEAKNVHYVKVKGHSDIRGNIIADKIAVKMRDHAVKKRLKEDPDYVPPKSYKRGLGYKDSWIYSRRNS